ncbi:MAG: hypothetical protein HY318_08650 [Armatimonadetes bacterium]|nr:hypothetical protein [Armatimonadota bacterium]
MKTPFILSVEIPDPLGHVHWQLWTVDRRGQNSRKLIWPHGEPRDVALDGKGNLLVLEKSNLWVYPVGSSSPRKVTGVSSGEFPLGVYGTIDGVCVRTLRLSSGRVWLNWAAGTLSASGVVKRETLMKSPLAPFLKFPTDVWYMTAAGGPRRRILRQVDAFATSPESDTVYFVRRRELRRVKVSEPR